MEENSEKVSRMQDTTEALMASPTMPPDTYYPATKREIMSDITTGEVTEIPSAETVFPRLSLQELVDLQQEMRDSSREMDEVWDSVE